MSKETMDDEGLGVFIREQQKDLSVRKSIKVKLPIRQHVKLHALKLFTDHNISENVEIALDEYFSRLEEEDSEAGAAGEVAGEVAEESSE